MSWYEQGGSSQQPPQPSSGEPPPPPATPPPPPGDGGQPHTFRTSAPEPAPAYGAPSAPPAQAGTEKLAVWTFVLGLLSIFILGLILGVVALVLSRKATENIRASGGQLGGSGLVTAGRILAIIGIIGWIIVIALQAA